MLTHTSHVNVKLWIKVAQNFNINLQLTEGRLSLRFQNCGFGCWCFISNKHLQYVADSEVNGSRQYT